MHLEIDTTWSYSEHKVGLSNLELGGEVVGEVDGEVDGEVEAGPGHGGAALLHSDGRQRRHVRQGLLPRHRRGAHRLQGGGQNTG